MNSPFSRTLPDLIRENAAMRGDGVAAICGERSITFAELSESAARIAARVRASGIRRGDRVALIMSNRIEWLEIAFGAMMAGAVVVPFSTWSTREELKFLIADSGAKLLFALASFGERDYLADLEALNPTAMSTVIVDAGARSCPFVRYEDFCSGSEPLEQLPPGEGPSSSDDALVLYTSGSTSIPKAVRLKQFGIIENGFNIGERQGLHPQDRVFLSAPLFWSYGGANALPATFTHGATLVLLEKFEPGAALDVIETNGCTAIYTLPAMTDAMIQHEHFSLERTKTLRTGLTIGTHREFRTAVAKFGVRELCNIYGATETYGNCCVTWHHWGEDRRAECQGDPLPGHEFRFRDEHTGELVPLGAPGLLEVRGYVMAGYSGKSAKLNSEVFTADGFYKTGDVGRLDENGAFIFISRNTEMIKRSGINVSPAEIEDVLLTSPDVSQCAVVGVPDDKRGQQIVAYAVLTAGGSATPEELAAFLRKILSKYKIPDLIRICDALPLTPTGKLSRKQLKEDAEHFLKKEGRA